MLGKNSWCTPLEYFSIPSGKKKLSVKWFPVFKEQTSLTAHYSHHSEVHPFQSLPPSLSQQVHLLIHILSPEHQLSPHFVFLSPPKRSGAHGSQWRWGQRNREHRKPQLTWFGLALGVGWVFGWAELGTVWGHGSASPANHSQPQSHLLPGEMKMGRRSRKEQAELLRHPVYLLPARFLNFVLWIILHI